MIGESTPPKGEKHVVTPTGVMCGRGVQHDRDKRTDVQHVGSLDVEVGNDGSLIVGGVRGEGGVTGLHLGGRRRRLDEECSSMSLIREGDCCMLFFLQECSGRENSGTSSVSLFLHGFNSGYHGLEFALELDGLNSGPGVVVGGHRHSTEEVRSLGYGGRSRPGVGTT
jgi:hypothetical protein